MKPKYTMTVTYTYGSECDQHEKTTRIDSYRKLSARMAEKLLRKIYNDSAITVLRLEARS